MTNNKSTYFFNTSDNNAIAVYYYQANVALPKGAVLIVHGMMEHAQRYAEFAQYLNQSGYHVYCYDQRGHGQTGEVDGLGHLPPKTTWGHFINDCNSLITDIQDRHPTLKVTLFGHSMGSFVALNTLIQTDIKLAHVILSGSCYEPPVLTRIGILLSQLLLWLLPAKTKGYLFHALIFGVFNLHFFPSRTPADWISRDNNKVDDCINDPQTGFCCSNYFFNVLFSGLNTLFQTHTITSIPNIPLLLISGSADPIAGRKLKKLKQLISLIAASGHTSHTVKVYPKARHELINEINRQAVFADVVSWLDKRQ